MHFQFTNSSVVFLNTSMGTIEVKPVGSKTISKQSSHFFTFDSVFDEQYLC